MSNNEETHWGLVMPFVCCESNGGTYQDRSFVAGARFSQDMEQLRVWKIDGTEPLILSVYPDMVAQYDLLAMQHGLEMTAEPWAEHPDEWMLLTFACPESEAS